MEAIQSFCDYFGEDRLETMDDESAVIYGLTGELTLALFNEAWFVFARENNAPPEFYHRYGLGGSYVDCLPDDLAEYFVGRLSHSIHTRTSWVTDYEAPSPTCYRRFHMQVLPMDYEMGCIITNSCLVEVPHDEHDDPRYVPHAMRDVYFAEDGVVTMCSHCRRTQRVDRPYEWDWVPRFVDHPPTRVTHGICGPCLAYFSPASSLRPPWV